MQLGMYQRDSKNEIYDRRMYRLSQKWLIESEMWLVCLIIVELASIYKFANLNDQRLEIGKALGMTEEQIKSLENN